MTAPMEKKEAENVRKRPHVIAAVLVTLNVPRLRLRPLATYSEAARRPGSAEVSVRFTVSVTDIQ